MTVPPQAACSGGHDPDARGRCRRCGQFGLGNTLAVRHGAEGRALAARVPDCLARIEQALDGGPGAGDRFGPARHQAAAALARVELLQDYLGRCGWFDGRGRPRPATRQLLEASAGLLRWLDALGMTPASAGRLGVDLAKRQVLDLRAELAEGRRLRQEAERIAAGGRP